MPDPISITAIGAAVSLFSASASLRSSTRKKWKSSNVDAYDSHDSDEFDPDKLRLDVLYEPKDDDYLNHIDVIFVHGPGEGREATWSTDRVTWPRDLLPEDLPQARIMTFGYPVQVGFRWNEAGLMLFYDALNFRRNTRSQTRPLIFVAHGLGGIVVKAALLHSYELGEDAGLLIDSTKCVFFFGTPQRGSSRSGWQESITQFSRLTFSSHDKGGSVNFRKHSAPKFIQESLKDDEIIRIATRFAKLSSYFRVVSFYETQTTITSRGPSIIVGRESALMGIATEITLPADSDHIRMVKFESSDDPTYQQFLEEILKCVQFERLPMSGRHRRPPISRYESDYKSTGPSRRTLARPPTWTQEPDESSAAASPTVIESDLDRQSTKTKSPSVDLVEGERQFLSKLKQNWLEDAMIPDKTPGSCEWITTSSVQFTTWHEGNLPGNPILCIYGRSGTGKTVIAKYLTTWLRDKAHSEKPILADTGGPTIPNSIQILSYFFDARSSSRNNTIDVIRSLIYQLLSNDSRLFQFIYGTPLWEGVLYGQSGFDSISQCLDLCENMMKDPMTRKLAIVIDALDECEELSRPELFAFLATLRGMSKIKIVVTSRLLYDGLDSPLPIDLDKSEFHSSQDVDLYINLEVNKLALRRRLDPDLREEIREKLKQKSGGSFLWIQLTLQTLQRYKTPKYLSRALSRQSSDIHDSFSSFVDMINEPELMLILHFIACAQAPITVDELSAFLAFTLYQREKKLDQEKAIADGHCDSPMELDTSPDLSDIIAYRPLDLEGDLDRYQPLIQITEGYVTLVHQQVHDWLVSVEGLKRLESDQLGQMCPGLSPSSLSATEAVHALMAKSCLYYIIASSGSNADPLTFLNYSSCFWPNHLKLAADQLSVDEVSPVVETLLGDEADGSVFATWISHLERSHLDSRPTQRSRLFTLAAFDICQSLESVAKYQLAESLEEKDEFGRTPLHLAAANNSLDSVLWLRQHAPNLGPLVTTQDLRGDTPLDLAIMHGHLELSKTLINCISWTEEPKLSFQLINSSIKAGEKAIFSMLLKQAPLSTLTDVNVRYILKNAVLFDDLELFKFVKRQRPDIEIRQYLLGSAVQSRSEEIVIFLLHQGLDVNWREDNYDTCLHFAVRLGLLRIVKILLDNGANPSPVNNTGETPLHIACRIGAEDIAKILMEKGAAVSTMDKEGLTALYFAAKYGHVDVIRLLLNCGSNVNIRGNNSQTPLQVAVVEGHMPAADLLLQAEAELDASVLHTAVIQSNLEMVELLLKHGADPNEPTSGESQETPLEAAVRIGRKEIEECLRGWRDLHYDTSV